MNTIIFFGGGHFCETPFHYGFPCRWLFGEDIITPGNIVIHLRHTNTLLLCMYLQGQLTFVSKYRQATLLMACCMLYSIDLFAVLNSYRIDCSVRCPEKQGHN